MAKTKKTASITFRLEPETKAQFEKACEKKLTTSSNELYKAVHQIVRYSKAKPISLKEFKDRK